MQSKVTPCNGASPQACPSPSAAMFYFQTTTLHFSAQFQEMVYLAGSFAGVGGKHGGADTCTEDQGQPILINLLVQPAGLFLDCARRNGMHSRARLGLAAAPARLAASIWQRNP